MPHDILWFNDALAGPSDKHTLFSREPSASPYKTGLSVHEGDTGLLQHHTTRPQFNFPSIDGEELRKMPGYRKYPLRSVAYNSDQTDSSTVVDSLSSSSFGVFDASALDDHRSIEETESSAIFQHDYCAVWSSFHRQQGTLASFQSCSSISSQGLTESEQSPQAIIPEIEEVDDLRTDSALPPQTLSPYAPMPLPPIFCIESQPQTIHTAINFVPSFPLSFRPTEDDKGLPIDPVPAPCPPGDSELTASPAAMLFTRGSMPIECNWPPFLSVASQTLAEDNVYLYGATGILLEHAKRLAREYRAAGPDILPLPFLLSFMGQTDGQPPWTCYIHNCGKQLARKSHMVDHIRMHLDERVYACEHCPQTFLRKADCKRHSVAHNPEKAFRCNLCIKSFGRKDLLTRHRRKCEMNFNNGKGALDSTRKQSRRRKGLQGDFIANLQSTQNIAFNSSNAGNIWPMPSEDFKRLISLDLKFDEADKENTPPFLISGRKDPSRHGTDVVEGPRKKARTKF